MNITARSGPEDVVDEVLRCESRRLTAMRDGDVSVLEELLADNLSYVFSSGKLDDRDGVLTAMRSGLLRYGEGLGIDELEIRASADSAVLLGILRIHIVLPESEVHARNRFTMHWTRADDGWQLASWQSTGLPD